MRLLVAAIPVVIISACATAPPAPSDVAFTNADFGAVPTNYEAIVKGYYDASLKDPDSVRYRSISTPQKQWIGTRGTESGQYGYLVCAVINAKNTYGAYVGYKTDAFLLRDGRIVRYVKDGTLGEVPLC